MTHRSLKFIEASQVSIKRIERNKRKHVTAIHGLEAFGMCITFVDNVANVMVYV
jgi:translation initiation factor 1 (eIF-1/SUI1)